VAVAPILLVGSLKAARFVAGGRESRAESRSAVRPLANIAIGLSALSACVAILFGTVLSLFQVRAVYSKEPNLHLGDLIVSVNAPVMGEIHRGDLLAFPFYWNTTGIQRVAGLPGDRIRVESGKLIRNGKVVAERYAAKSYTAEFGDFPLPTEAFPDGLTRWQHANAYGAGPNKDKDFVVPENTYFLLNDDRNELMDSRILGPLNRRHISGRAMFACSPGSLPRLLR
jgi:signal peptidase I